jgi:hypothetical protein
VSGQVNDEVDFWALKIIVIEVSEDDWDSESVVMLKFSYALFVMVDADQVMIVF